MSRKYKIAVIEGDGIGPEVCRSAVAVLNALFPNADTLELQNLPGGASYYAATGDSVLPDKTFEACKRADAILHGSAGLPSVCYPDGTEAGVDFGLSLRFRLDMFANVRYVRLRPGVRPRLLGTEPGSIDYVVVRENTEGLYASRGGGIRLGDRVAADMLVLTRPGVERVARFAFELASRRSGAPEDGRRRVTVCDKANVLRSFAFFREICREVAQDYPDIEIEFCMVDAMVSYLVSRPQHYDVIVCENMFGDIISDLGPTTAGGLGLSPTAEIGDRNGFFQAAHGSAPDIAGKGIANPLGTILSAGLMLEWLGERNDDGNLVEAARRLDETVDRLLGEGRILTADLGGSVGTQEVTERIVQALK